MRRTPAECRMSMNRSATFAIGLVSWAAKLASWPRSATIVLSVPAQPSAAPPNSSDVAAPGVAAYVAPMGDLAPISLLATLLFANGQTTERTIVDTERLAAALGHQVSIIVRWGELIVRYTEPGATIRNEIVVVSPTGIDMHKVAAATSVIDDVCAHRIDAAAAQAALASAARQPPASLVRFATL